MADQVKDFEIEEDGSCTLGIVFDVAGKGFNPVLADNYTPLRLDPPLDGHPAWTLESAQATLAVEIVQAKAAFLAAAPG